MLNVVSARIAADLQFFGKLNQISHGATVLQVVQEELLYTYIQYNCRHFCSYSQGNRQTDRQTDGWTDGRMDGQRDRQILSLIHVLFCDKQRVFCGHEYTVNNLKYALHVEPENTTTKEKFTWAKEQRANNLPTIPSSIEEELKTNPFMRVDNSAVQKHCRTSEPVSTMGFLREEKNNFRGQP